LYHFCLDEEGISVSLCMVYCENIKCLFSPVLADEITWTFRKKAANSVNEGLLLDKGQLTK